MPSISTSSATTTFALSGNNTIDSLLNPDHVKWSSGSVSVVALTYSFPWYKGALAYWQSNYGSNSELQATQLFGLNDTQIIAATNAFQAWANVANITFTQVADTATNVGDFRFAFSSAISSNIWGYSYYPNSYYADAADVWINSSHATEDWSVGSFNYLSLIHEIGHGLGLKHPGMNNEFGTSDPAPYLPTALDYKNYTVMSYNESKYLFLDDSHHTYIIVNPETPMVYDIAAIQYLYGANTAYRTGNDIYTFDPSHPFYKSLWDAGGNDTIDISNFSTSCTIDLTPGHYSSLRYINHGTGDNLYDGTNNLGIAFGTIIENATGGSGNDYIIGNDAANKLNGGGGNDTLDGGSGTDTAIFRGNYADYHITYDAATNKLTITDNIANRDGIDVVTNVENFQFADVTKPYTTLAVAVADTQAPTVLTFSPADGLTGVGIGSDIVLTFSEAIQKGVGTITLHSDSAAGPVFANHDASTSGNLSISGSTLTINPTADLANGTHYFVTISDGSIKDFAGHAYAGTSSYDFTTVMPPDFSSASSSGGSGTAVVLAGVGALGFLAWVIL